MPSGGFVQEQSEIGDKSAIAITLKSPEDLKHKHMCVAGRLAAEVLQVVAPYVKPGVTTEAMFRGIRAVKPGAMLGRHLWQQVWICR